MFITFICVYVFVGKLPRTFVVSVISNSVPGQRPGLENQEMCLQSRIGEPKCACKPNTFFDVFSHFSVNFGKNKANLGIFRQISKEFDKFWPF